MAFFSQSEKSPIVANRLKNGDEVRIIAPARSLGIISKDNVDYAIARLEEFGLRPSFSEHASDMDGFNSSSIAARVADLEAAFKDEQVKGILSVVGGFNSNQILDSLNYDIIRSNPKVFCGFSDITCLLNAIYAKTGLVTYHGPHFSSFAMQQGLEYTLDYFREAVFADHSIQVSPSKKWSDDDWYLDQENRDFKDNSGYWLIQPGDADGPLIGGNITNFVLLSGTGFMPPLKDAILFLEECALMEDHNIEEFDRHLSALCQQPDAASIKGLVIGRFEDKYGITLDKLKMVIGSKQLLNNKPVIANVDFGHTSPMVTLPIGGQANLSAQEDRITLSITASATS